MEYSIDVVIVGVIVILAVIALGVDLIYLAIVGPKRKRRLDELRAGKKNLEKSPLISS